MPTSDACPCQHYPVPETLAESGLCPTVWAVHWHQLSQLQGAGHMLKSMFQALYQRPLQQVGSALQCGHCISISSHSSWELGTR